MSFIYSNFQNELEIEVNGLPSMILLVFALHYCIYAEFGVGQKASVSVTTVTVLDRKI